jgi:hypothetical protein
VIGAQQCCANIIFQYKKKKKKTNVLSLLEVGLYKISYKTDLYEIFVIFEFTMKFIRLTLGLTNLMINLKLNCIEINIRCIKDFSNKKKVTNKVVLLSRVTRIVEYTC